MKTMMALILSSMSLVATAQATEQYGAPACDIYEGKVNYTCIANKLQAYNSSYFFDLTVEKINKLLYTCEYGHAKAVEYANSEDCQKGL